MFPFQKIDTVLISWQAFDVFFLVLVLGTSIAVTAVINVSASRQASSAPHPLSRGLGALGQGV